MRGYERYAETGDDGLLDRLVGPHLHPDLRIEVARLKQTFHQQAGSRANLPCDEDFAGEIRRRKVIPTCQRMLAGCDHDVRVISDQLDANALLAEIAGLDERVVIIEDTRELRCDAKDAVTLRTKPGVANLADLVRSTLRLRPDRIIVGEVRGAEALDMLKAWNTGHPGGIATVHANSARAALYWIEQLIQEAVTTVPRRLIAEAIDLIVFIKGRGPARRIDAVVELKGLDPSGDYLLEIPPGLPTAGHRP